MATYPRMSSELNKEEYKTYRDQKVMLNGRVVSVSITTRSNRYGSWRADSSGLIPKLAC